MHEEGRKERFEEEIGRSESRPWSALIIECQENFQGIEKGLIKT